MAARTLRHAVWPLILLFGLLLSGCRAALPAAEPGGRVLLWHSFNETETPILNQILQQYQEIHPQTRIISVMIPAAEMQRRYQETADLGLGPDLFIGRSDWIRELADAGLIRGLERNDWGGNDYLAAAALALRYQEQFYGLPLSLQPVALFYNPTLVAAPAADLDEWLQQAEAGQRIALTPRFGQMYWGIGVFGDVLFDNAENFELRDSGFNAWLDWLKAAQESPGVIMLRDETTLQNLFIQEQVAYYVARPDVIPALTAAMDAGKFAVAPLPALPGRRATPLLPVDAVMLNTASSQRQQRVALSLAQFLTNPEQSLILLRDAGRVPANRQVRVDARVYPLLAGFVAQSQTAVVIPNWVDLPAFTALGDAVYSNVLAGVLSSAGAVCQFGLDVARTQSVPLTEFTLPEGCLDGAPRP